MPMGSMSESSEQGSSSRIAAAPAPHHVQQQLCQTRALYRQGRKLTAVKVYTVNDESQHLLISGVPKLQLFRELKAKFQPYGELRQFHVLPDYPCEIFTETFHAHYQRIQSARVAKRLLDGFNFYGGALHVFYAPELETESETRHKLQQRRRDLEIRIRRHKQDPTNPELDPYQPEPEEQPQRKKKRPALPQALCNLRS